MKEPRKSPPSKSRTKAEEKLDEELEEFFPASDPPANTPTSAGGPGAAAARSVPRPASRRNAADRRRRVLARVSRYAVGRMMNAPVVVAMRLVVLDHAQAVDRREAWPLAHLGDKRLDSRGRAADQRLDRAVGPVAHPAGDAEPQRRAAGELAIADALDVAFDHDAADDGAGFGHGALSSPSDNAARSSRSGRQMRRRS